MIRTMKRRTKVSNGNERKYYYNALESTRTTFKHIFLYLNGKCRYSIILSSNENIRPYHTQLSRKSVKRIREWKLKKTKEQNNIHGKIYKKFDDYEQWFSARY